MWRRFLFWSSTAGIYNRARPRERGDRGLFLPIGKKSLFIPGCVQGAIILISLSVCPSVCVSSVCVTFVVFTDCESCTRAILPISTNPGSMEAGEYGQTLVTCFVARLLEVVAVAGLLWISCCVLGGADFFASFFFDFFFSLNAHGLLQV